MSHSSFKDWQRMSVFAAVVLAVIGARRFTSGPACTALALASVAVAIWHGAFDGVLAEEVLQPRYGSRWRPSFYAVYLVLAAMVALLWWLAPLVALVAFLLYSALHFGTEMERELSLSTILLGTAAGFFPIAAACRWWPMQVSSIFAVMLRQHAASALTLTVVAGQSLWAVALFAFFGTLLKSPGRLPSVIALGATELLLFRTCSPIIAFAVFFCVWHTSEHMLSTSLDDAHRFQPDRFWSHLRRGFGMWLFSLTGLALLCWYGRHTLAGLAGAIFIALSALTVPHMALAEFCRRLSPQRHPPVQFQLSQQEVVH